MHNRADCCAIQCTGYPVTLCDLLILLSELILTASLLYILSVDVQTLFAQDSVKYLP